MNIFEYIPIINNKRVASDSQKRIIEIIKCPNKIHNGGVCPPCWSCKVCGRSGCDNRLDFNAEYIEVECDQQNLNNQIPT